VADQDTDLVGKVEILGIDETKVQLNDLGKTGEEAFEKIGDAAEKAGDQVKKSSDDQTKANTKAKKSTEDLGKAFEDLGKSLQPRPVPGKVIDDLGKSVGNLVHSVKKGVKDVVEFGTRVAALGAAGTAAGIGLLAMARSISQQVSSATSAADKQLQVQTENANRLQDSATAAIQYRSQLRELNRQLVNGAIDQTTYNARLEETKEQFKEQRRVAEELADAQEDARLEMERLQKQAADQKAWDSLADKLGGPLLGSLVQLGNQVEVVRKDFVSTFSPALSKLIDVIGDAFQENTAQISAFATNAAQQITQFATQNGPAISQAISGITKIVEAFIGGLIQAGPIILKLINDVIIPAFQAVMATLDEIAAFINETFGTKINAAFLLGLIGVLKFTKAIQAMLGVIAIIRNFALAFGALQLALTYATGAVGGFTGAIRALMALMSPWTLAIIALAAAFIYFKDSVDWTYWGQVAVAAFNSVLNAGAALNNFFTVTIPAAFAASRDYIVELWNGVVEFFTELPGKIADIFTSIATSMANAFLNGINTIIGYIKSFVAKAINFLQPIVDAMNFIAGEESGGAAPPQFAGGGHVGSGHVRGPGTGTSDSIFALLSDNEFVVRAAAVRKYGLAFLRAVNSGQLNLGDLAGYALGGLVGVPQARVPAFAGGGSVGASGGPMRSLTLALGGETFEGLLVPENVAGSLERYAISKSSRAAGRSPSWRGSRG
jgi:hypothetical protein